MFTSFCNKKDKIPGEFENLSSEELNKMGMTYHKEKNYSESEKFFLYSTIKDPNYFKGFFNLACSQSLQNKEEEALNSLKTAFSINNSWVTKNQNDPDLNNIKNLPDFNKIFSGSEEFPITGFTDFTYHYTAGSVNSIDILPDEIQKLPNPESWFTTGDQYETDDPQARRILSFKNDGSFSLEKGSAPSYTVEGKYSFSNNILTLTFERTLKQEGEIAACIDEGNNDCPRYDLLVSPEINNYKIIVWTNKFLCYEDNKNNFKTCLHNPN